MGRPAARRWLPLGVTTDPVPGDPAEVRREAAHLAMVAREISAQVEALKKIAAAGSDAELLGHFASTIRSAAGGLSGELGKVVGRYRKVSAALSAYAPDLEEAQALSLRALHQAEVPHGRLVFLEAQNLPSGALTPHQCQQVQAHQAAVQRAEDELAAARALLARAMTLRDDSAGRQAARIRAAINDGVADSLWDEFKEAVGDVAWLLGDLCTVAEVLASVLALAALVIGLIVPGLDLIDALLLTGFWLTFGAGVGRFVLAATGNGSWWDFALDAFACLTFGASKGLSAGLEATTTTAETTGTTLMAGEMTSGKFAAQISSYARLTGEEEQAVTARLAPKMISQIDEPGQATMLQRMLLSEDDAVNMDKVHILAGRFAGSAELLADAATAKSLTRALLTTAGTSWAATLGGATGAGITISGPTGHEVAGVHVPGVSPWYTRTFEKPTTTAGGLTTAQVKDLLTTVFGNYASTGPAFTMAEGRW